MIEGIQKSIRKRDKLHEEVLKENNPAFRTAKQILYIYIYIYIYIYKQKSYCRITKKSIVTQYRNRFEKYRHSCQQTWRTINETVSSKHKTKSYYLSTLSVDGSFFTNPKGCQNL